MRVPLSRLIPSAVVPDVLRTLLDAVEVTDFNLVTSDTAVDVAVTLASASGDPRIEIGGADGFAVVFRQVAALDLHLEGSLEIRLGLSEVTIELPSVLRPAQLVGGRWEPIAGQRQTLSLRSAHGGLGVRWHSADGFSLVWPEDPSGTVDVPAIELKETLIADTRIVVSARNVDVIPDPENLRIEILEATVVLPSDLPAAPDLKFSDVRIDRRGFTGTAEAAWNDVAFDATTRTFSGSVAGQLFGWHGGLDSVLLELNETLPIAADIRGKLLVPYFDEPVDVRVNLGAGGIYTVTLDAPTGDITLTREDLLELRLRSLSLGVDAASVATMRLSGGLTPLLMGSDGLEWPDFDVKDLTVDSTGKFTIAQAWVDLKDLATLDLWGFHFELRRIGLGYEEPRDRLWLDLSGGLRLIEAVPLGVDVEGFRLNWPRLLLDGGRTPLSLEQIQQTVAQIEVSFDGVYLFYGIPETVEFEGLIRFIKSAQSVAFAADIALRVPAAGFAAEAGLLIGMNLGQPPYPFLYVYFGVELPAGIPLGQSGLALKGALGLFGINVAPEKTAEQNWYYDWYKRGPMVGAHPTNKWRDERNAIALGIGVTITTVDGFVKGTRGLLIVVLPGPVLILEGRALLLEGLAPGEPPLRALAVFDGREKTIQLNIDAQAELIENTLEASGGVEAFFDLEDLSNWHLYLGQDSPRDRRVRANVLDLLRADSYLMLDSGGGGAFRARMGASAEFAPEIPDFGPVSAVASLDLDGDGLLTVGPEQLSGDVGLEASVKLSAFGFAMRLGARARVLLEGPRPFKVEAELEMEADLPDPLPDFEASFPFSWQGADHRGSGDRIAGQFRVARVTVRKQQCGGSRRWPAGGSRGAGGGVAGRAARRRCADGVPARGQSARGRPLPPAPRRQQDLRCRAHAVHAVGGADRAVRAPEGSSMVADRTGLDAGGVHPRQRLDRVVRRVARRCRSTRRRDAAGTPAAARQRQPVDAHGRHASARQAVPDARRGGRADTGRGRAGGLSDVDDVHRPRRASGLRGICRPRSQGHPRRT